MEPKEPFSSTFTLSFSKETLIYGLFAVNFGLLIVFAFQISDIKTALGSSDDQQARAVAVKKGEQANQQENEVVTSVSPPNKTDHIRGNEQAVISLIEYSDFECPYCQSFHSTAQQVVDVYEGRVNWIYRHFPLTIHAGAAKKALASECVAQIGGNNAFWDFADEVFDLGTASADNDLERVATSTGISSSAFQDCLNAGDLKSHIDEDFASGQAAGVTGTPGNLLYNNETGESLLIPGALPFSQVQAAINQLL